MFYIYTVYMQVDSYIFHEDLITDKTQGKVFSYVHLPSEKEEKRTDIHIDRQKKRADSSQ